MLIIPAIDLKDGKCVRLKQGEMDDATEYDSPAEAAARWVDQGAERLHLVDLNGAFAGKPMNADVVKEITNTYPELDVQVGGGIRDKDTVQSYLEAGVRYVIIGTQAIIAPHFVEELCAEFPGHIIVGLDAKNGKVATDGWSKLSNHDVIDMAQRFEEMGVEAIIYTDISRDGMMNGVNIDATVTLAQAIRIPVIASGGITNMDDIRALNAVQDEGIMGAITGRAIYEGHLDFAEAYRYCKK